MKPSIVCCNIVMAFVLASAGDRCDDVRCPGLIWANCWHTGYINNANKFILNTLTVVNTLALQISYTAEVTFEVHPSILPLRKNFLIKKLLRIRQGHLAAAPSLILYWMFLKIIDKQSNKYENAFYIIILLRMLISVFFRNILSFERGEKWKILISSELQRSHTPGKLHFINVTL